MKDQSPPKKLTRSRTDRYIGGVAAGIAERIGIDPIFVRLAFVASLAFGGLGLLAYVAMLVALPIEGDPAEPLPALEPRRRNMMIGLAVLVGVVGIVTADSGATAAWLFGFWPGTVFGIIFWVTAAGLAIWLAGSGKLGRVRPDGGTAPAATSTAPAPPAPAKAETPDESPSEATTEVVTYAESPTQLSRTEIMETRQMDEPGVTDAEVVSDEPTPDRPASDDGPSTIGRIMTWFAIGITGLIVFCLLFVFSAGVTATLGGVPMAALVIILGAGMVFAGLRGRRQLSGWLLAAAVAVTLPMAAVSIADLRVEGPYGDIKKAPMAVTDIPADGYEMAAGNMTIDLRRFQFDRRRETPLEVESGMGLTSIIVPDDVCLAGSVDGKAGIVNLRGEQSNGINITQDSAGPVAWKPGMAARGGVLHLDAEFKLGAFEVIDDTQWRRDGRGGSFEDNDLEPSDSASAAARTRARAACAVPEPTAGRAGAPEVRN